LTWAAVAQRFIAIRRGWRLPVAQPTDAMEVLQQPKPEDNDGDITR
jgi:hypothetical protein